MNDYEKLQHDICVGKGFCGGLIDGHPRHVDDYIPPSGLVTAEQFVDWVFLAESSNAGQYEEHRGSLMASFIQHMGSNSVAAERLRWPV